MTTDKVKKKITKQETRTQANENTHKRECRNRKKRK